MRTHPKIRAVVDALSRNEADRGRLIDIGWRAHRQIMLVKIAPSAETEEQFRYAYFSGAQHLFASIIGILEEGSEPTPNDLRRMDLIHKELEAFERELEGYIALHMKTEGRG